MGLLDYLQLAWLVSSLASIGGALGAVIESDLAVREAMYRYHPDERKAGASRVKAQPR